MTGVLVGALGGLLILATAYDLGITTLGVARGAGPVTGRVADTTFALLRRLTAAGDPDRRHARLSAGGLVVLITTALVWVAGLWAGWTLVFAAAGDGIIFTDGREPAGLAERAYYAGYTLVTLGLGDVVPASSGWRIATVLCAATGLLLFTLGVTYLLSVIQASTQRRATASVLHGLGGSTTGMLRTAWTGEDFTGLDAHLPSLTSEIADLKQRQLAYPVVHYLHAPSTINGAPARIAALSDALDILQALPDDLAPRRGITEPARQVLGHLVDTLETQYVVPADEAPRLPSLDPLRDEGIPLPADDDVRRVLHDRRDHRAVLAGWVRHDGWDWADAVSLAAQRDTTEETPEPAEADAA